jgi:UDP-3-O-acyl-N-acetylglucosamine deacetylase
VRFEGLGLHSGVDVQVVVHPGSGGIAFLHKGERTLAIPENVTDTRRCTRLGSISTVEHLMSAFAALEITDADVEVSASEMPALDGSSRQYYDGLLGAGLLEIGEYDVPELFQRIFVQEEAIKIAVAKGGGRWRFCFETGDRWPRHQEFEIDDMGRYAMEVAPARTFGFEEEVAPIILAGMARGLDARSALVIAENGYRNEALFPDEPARHKLLDLIGDIYLSGVPVRTLDVVGERSGHRTNVAAAAKLRAATFSRC